MSAGKQIGTHDGTFHCDEALACFMLHLTDEYANAEVVRTRDPAVLDSLPIIVDVGGVYDPEKGRFDHHQRSFVDTLDADHKIRLSSAGLIYKHFGRKIIKKLTNASDQEVEILFYKTYTNFVEAIDGIDNGVSQYPAELKSAYKINTDLSSRVGMLNPSWNEEGIDVQQRFKEAMEMAGREFVQCVMYYAKAWLPARQIVEVALKNRFEVDAGGEIMHLKNVAVWKSHLYALEEEQKISPNVKYVLFQDQAGKWRIQAVAETEGSFQSRIPLPEEWRGYRDNELSTISSIPDCVFVHASGFIGGNATYEGVLEMARKSLSMAKNKKQKIDN